MEDFYEQIEDYNLGKMTDAEAAQFEAAMTVDPALEKAVLQHRAEWEAQEMLAENILRSQIQQQFEAQPPAKSDPFRINRNWLLPILLLVVGAIGYILRHERPKPSVRETTPVVQDSVAPQLLPTDTSAQQPTQKPAAPPIATKEKKPDWGALALATYDMPESINGLRGQDGDTLSLAREAFSEKNYRKAVQLLSKLPEDSQQEALSLRAHAYFLSKNYTAASRDFSELEKGGVYRREAQWFGLLARMGTGKMDKEQLLKELNAVRNDEKHPYNKVSQELWKKVSDGL